MKVSVQLTRDIDGEITIAVDAYTHRGGIDELVKFTVFGCDAAVAAFEAMVILACNIEKVTKEEKS